MSDIQTPKKRVFLLDHEPGGGEPWTTSDDISQTPDTPSRMKVQKAEERVIS